MISRLLRPGRDSVRAAGRTFCLEAEGAMMMNELAF